MEELSKRFPPGIAYAMHYDTTRFVSAAMRDVVITLVEALLLVVFVVYVFLQSWRTTIIPTIAIPVSLIATLAVMQVCGFSLNMLSLLGMVLAIGLVVDDAIVVVENVERQLEAGLPPLAAAQEGDVGSDGADHRDDGGADGGVRAGRLHSRRRGPALQSVRADGRDFRRHFRLQFADAEPGAERGAFCATAPKGRFFLFRWFNAGFDWLAHGYARAVRVFIRFGWALVVVFVALMRRRLCCCRAASRRRSCRSRIRAISSSSCNCPTAPRWSAPTRSRSRCATSCRRRRASKSPASSAASIS